MSTRKRSTPLVSTEWLAGRLSDPTIAIVEVDEDTEAYVVGHIPGAVSLHWQHELQSSPRRDFIDGDELAALLGSKGVSSEATIVLYGGNSNWFATYAYWLFAYRGVANTVLLDGGRMKWEVEGRPLTAITTEPVAVPFERGPERPELRVFRDEVLGARELLTLVDVRSPAEFSGELLAPEHLPQEQPYVAGHVPGAHNVPWASAVNADGSFKTLEELRALYAASGVSPNGGIVTYCRIGERSSHSWFVLNELLGYPDVRNYDGSWTEYGSLVDAPVETGD